MLAQTALLKAIKYCGSKQKKLADLIGENADKVSYWLNRAKQIPFHQAIAIETVTDGLVSRYDLAPYARPQNKEQSVEIGLKLITSVKISERVMLGLVLEKKLGNRRGERNDLNDKNSHGSIKSNKNPETLGRKCDQVRGKTSKFVAKEAGFPSKDTYLRAKKVVKNGIVTLVEAMDNGNISIANASIISEFTTEEQELLITKNKKEMMDIVNKKNKKSILKNINNINDKDFFSKIMKNNELIEAEISYQLPLRLPLIGLINHSDKKSKFIWEVEHLKSQILPYVTLNFEKILNMLENKKLIEKVVENGLVFGRITI